MASQERRRALILRTRVENPDLGIRGLSRKLNIPSSTVSDVLRRFEERLSIKRKNRKIGAEELASTMELSPALAEKSFNQHGWNARSSESMIPLPCCVPGCINPLQYQTTELPCDKELLAHWSAAIQAGTGQALSDEFAKSGSLICQMHFALPQYPDGNGDPHRGPVLFFRDSIQIEVASCRLCLRHDTIDNMFNVEDSLVQGHSLQSMINKYFKLLHAGKECTERGYVCEGCTVKLDMTHAFGVQITKAAKQYRKLLRKADKMYKDAGSFSTTTNTVVRNEVVSNQEEQSSYSGCLDGIIVKEEAQLAEFESPYQNGIDESTSDNQMSQEYSQADGMERLVEQNMTENLEFVALKEEPTFPEWSSLELPTSVDPGTPSESTGHYVHKCYICNTIQGRKKQLEHHLVTDHTHQESHKCQECNIIFCCAMDCNLHFSQHAVKGPAKCSLCSMWFSNLFLKLCHDADHHGLDNGVRTEKIVAAGNCFCGCQNLRKGSELYCSLCGKRYFNQTELKRHERVDHRATTTPGKTFSSVRSLENHMRTHRNQPVSLRRQRSMASKHNEGAENSQQLEFLRRQMYHDNCTKSTPQRFGSRNDR